MINSLLENSSQIARELRYQDRRLQFANVRQLVYSNAREYQ